MSEILKIEDVESGEMGGLSVIITAENKIKSELEKEHVTGLTPKLSLMSVTGEIRGIVFYKDYKEKTVFARFDIEENGYGGYYCFNRQTDYNIGLPIENSPLLQEMFRTIVEETMEDIVGV